MMDSLMMDSEEKKVDRQGERYFTASSHFDDIVGAHGGEHRPVLCRKVGVMIKCLRSQERK